MAACRAAPGLAHRLAASGPCQRNHHGRADHLAQARRPPLPPHSGPLALYGIRVKTDGTIAVYVNGELVHRAQQQGPLWNSTRTPLWVVLERHADDAPVREILIRLEHTERTQVALSSLWLGPVETLRVRYHVRQWLQQELPRMLSAAFLAVGIFALFVWFKRRHETGYLLFFNLAVTSFLRGLHFYADLPIANDGFAWLTVNSLLWLVTVVHFFLRQLHGRALTWFTRALVGVTGLIGVLTLPGLAVLPNTPKVTPLIYPMAALMGAAVGLVGGISAWRRSNEGVLVAIGVSVCTLLGVSDWLLQNNFVSPEGWYFGAYTNAITFGIFGILMYRRYVNAISEVELTNANLAQRLKHREAELESSHQRLRAAERQQAISAERQRLMQDMHDGLGASLISAIRSVERGAVSDAKVSQILKSCLDDLEADHRLDGAGGGRPAAVAGHAALPAGTAPGGHGHRLAVGSPEAADAHLAGPLQCPAHPAHRAGKHCQHPAPHAGERDPGRNGGGVDRCAGQHRRQRPGLRCRKNPRRRQGERPAQPAAPRPGHRRHGPLDVGAGRHTIHALAAVGAACLATTPFRCDCRPAPCIDSAARDVGASGLMEEDGRRTHDASLPEQASRADRTIQFRTGA